MIVLLHRRGLRFGALAAAICFLLPFTVGLLAGGLAPADGKTIRWVDFDVPYEALDYALELDIQSHTEGEVPNVIVEADGKTPETLGELIYFFEYACGLSAHLLGVNPFDQPGVEAYKRNMFALLGKPGYESQRAELEAKLAK